MGTDETAENLTMLNFENINTIYKPLARIIHTKWGKHKFIILVIKEGR